MRSQWRLVFSVSWFCSVIRFQRWLGLFGYEISVMVCFIHWRDTSFQFKLSITLVLFGYEISMIVGLFRYEILMMVGFVRLWELNELLSLPGGLPSIYRPGSTQFRWSVLFSYEISMTSVLFGYEISKTDFFCYEISTIVGFVPLRDFNNGWFCFVTRF